MSAYAVTLLITDMETGKTKTHGRWLQVGPGEIELASIAEVIHDDLIDTEEKADNFCQHR